MFVLNICSGKNTGRLPNLRYRYKGELREIDLVTSFETQVFSPKRGENFQHTVTRIVIACKKSAEKPWVFFSTPRYPPRPLTDFLKYLSDFDLQFFKTKRPRLRHQIRKYLSRIHYSLRDIPACISYCQAFKKASDPSDIYDAIHSVLSYINYDMDLRLKQRQATGQVTIFYFPVVVLDGSLFEAQVEGDQIEVHARDHIQLRTGDENDMFVVDIVTKERFINFFELVEQDHNTFIEAINNVRFPKAHKSLIRAALRKQRRSILTDREFRELVELIQDSKDKAVISIM